MVWRRTSRCVDGEPLSRPGRLLSAIIMGVAGLLLLAGMGVAFAVRGASPSHNAERRDSVSPVKYSETINSHRFSSSSGESPEEVLQRVVSRLGGETIVEAKIGTAPIDFRPTEDPSVPVPPEWLTGKWLLFTVRADEAGPSALRAFWEADLVTGAVRDLLVPKNVTVVSAVTSVALPSGKVVSDARTGMGNVVEGQVFSDDSPQEVELELRRAAEHVGLNVEAISVLRGIQAAPALVVSTEGLDNFATNVDSMVNEIFGIPPRYEGFYFEVKNKDGEPVFRQTAAFRAGVGHRWMRPDLDPRERASRLSAQ